MRLTILILTALALAAAASAQRHKLAAINAETPEGKLLQSIGTESDPAKKLTLMEQFVAEHGKHEAAGWVFSQMQTGYTKAGNHDKAIEAGEKLLALDNTDMEAAYANLKAAEAKKDAEGVAKWAGVTSEIAKKVPSLPKREDQTEEELKHAVDFASQVTKYTEYAFYAAALQETDPQKIMKLGDTLEQRNAQSEYIVQIMPKYAQAARQANALPNALAFGERAFARGQFQEDMLLVMADASMQQKNADKTLTYSTKLISHMAAAPKPEGISDADWAKKKTTMTGLANWMAGMAAANQSRWGQADKSLRAAMPDIKDNEQLLAPALFHLGLANYQMGRGKNRQQMADAVAFLKQCAAIKSPYQAQAQKNLTVIAKETGAKPAK
jgi:tetratricopeptide (TPR) repeat protein